MTEQRRAVGAGADKVAEAVTNPETSHAGRPAGRVVVLGQTSAGRRLKVVLAGEVVVTVVDRDEEA